MKARNATNVLLGTSIEYQAYYLCRFNLAAVLPLLIAAFALTHSEAGALNAIIFLSYALILFPAGILGDVVGPRVVITLGAIVSFVMNLLFSYSTSFQSMMALQFMNGVGQGMAWGPLTRLMANWFPKERMSFVMTLVSVPLSLAPTFTFILSGYFASYFGWRAAFQIPAVILAAASLCFAIYVRDRPEASSSSSSSTSRRDILHVLRKREVWLVGMTYLAFFGAIRGFLAWLPTFLVERMGMTLLGSSTLGGLLSLPGIVTMFAGTWMSDVRLGGRKNIVIAASLLAPIPLLILLPLTRDTTLVLVMVGFILSLFNISGGLYFAYPAVLLPKEQVGTASGLIDMLGYVGIFLSSLAIGIAVDTFKSYDPMFLILTAMAVFGVLTILKVKS
ncbi:MAG TPA: MFS transporter [Candidatus Bathyarchaeia archaeon]|nr:MFS transporter [Candidatus Bathyarchaeia archaeon]